MAGGWQGISFKRVKQLPDEVFFSIVIKIHEMTLNLHAL